MLNKIITSMMAVLAFSIFAATAARAQDLTVMTENYPPLNYLADGKAGGPSVEIVQLIMDRLGTNSEIKVLPWARAYMLTRETENHILFSMTRIESREDLFKWVGPLAVKRHAFYTAEGSGITIKSLDDARGLIIGVQLDGVDQDFLVRNGFDNLDGISRWQLNAKKLLNGRIDVWLASTVSADEVLRQQNLTGRIKKQAQAFQRPLYIAFNKKTPDSLIERWQAIRDEIYRDGTARAIFEQHEQLPLLPDS